MTTLYDSHVIDIDEEQKVNNFYRSEKVVEHKGFKFMYRFIVCGKPKQDDEVQAVFVMVNGKWEFLINSLSVGIKKFDDVHEAQSVYDEKRDELFSKFDNYIESVY